MTEGSMCFASFDLENYLVVLEPSSNGFKHSVTMQSFVPGEKAVGIKCEDSVGNVAYKNISFRVEMDNSAPDIARVYYYSGLLYIKTNEPASCSISPQGCDFEFANGTLMSGNDREHTERVDLNKLYYLRCKDLYNNARGSCDQIIKVV